MENPMTTPGDIIVGGVDGAPTRLAKGANGKILGVVGGALAWIDAPASGETDTDTWAIERGYFATGPITVGTYKFCIAKRRSRLLRIEFEGPVGGDSGPIIGVYVNGASAAGFPTVTLSASTGGSRYGSGTFINPTEAIVEVGEQVSLYISSDGSIPSTSDPGIAAVGPLEATIFFEAVPDEE